VVVDISGALIGDAQVIIRKTGGRPEQTKKTNQKGEFRFTAWQVELTKSKFRETDLSDYNPDYALDPAACADSDRIADR